MNKREWQTAAYSKLVRFARRARKPFIIEQARSKIKIDPPADLRWWGSVTKHAIKDGVLWHCGWAPAKSSHYSPKRMYRSGLAG